VYKVDVMLEKRRHLELAIM